MVTADTFRRGLKNGIKTFLELSKIMVPVYLAVKILSLSGLLNYIAGIFNPLMSIFGLPGETSLTLILGYFVGIYGALGSMAAINLTAVQATTIGIMISTAHYLIGETAVVKKMGVSASASIIVRMFFSLLLGFLYYRISR
jgi:spore maturation protein SpmB